jgi:hypothetical protein
VKHIVEKQILPEKYDDITEAVFLSWPPHWPVAMINLFGWMAKLERRET